ncbi:MAG: Holliday junction branch migration protein RuvA [Patescibacteria group bacterium]
MLAYLVGKIVSKGERQIVLSTGPLAFEIAVNDFLINAINLDQEVKIYTHLHSREDALELYGFLTQDEKEFFRLLISISGIGPRSAIGILSITTPDKLRQAISQEKAEMLTVVSGIGKKTAERIIIELKGKFKNFNPGVEGSVDSELFEALIGLGYKANDIRQVVQNLPAGEMTLSEKVKLALRNLS